MEILRNILELLLLLLPGVLFLMFRIWLSWYAEQKAEEEISAKYPHTPLFWGKVEIISSNQHKDENIPQGGLFSRNQSDTQLTSSC